MHKYLLLLLTLFPSFLKADFIESFLENLPAKSPLKVVFYIGTFDPPHPRHQEIIEGLKTQADFVIPIPNDFTAHKPLATPVTKRTDMLKLLYAEDSKVLVPENYENWGAPISKRVLQALRNRVPHIQVGASMGMDSYQSQKSYQAARLVPVDFWVISSKEAEHTLPEKMHRKDLHFIHIPTQNDVRSSEIRKVMRDARSDESKWEELNHMLDSRVVSYIQKDPDIYSRDPSKKITWEERGRACMNFFAQRNIKTKY